VDFSPWIFSFNPEPTATATATAAGANAIFNQGSLLKVRIK
jgi:hypothetical protein